MPPDELRSVKNRYLADTYRQLTSNFQVMLRYGVAEGRGSWRDFDRINREALAVTPTDVQRVAQRYFTKENRAVAIWTRKAGSASDDPALAALPAEAQGMVRQMLTQIRSSKDPNQLQQMLGRLEQRSSQAPPEMKPALDYIRAKVQSRLAELGEGAGKKE